MRPIFAILPLLAACAAPAFGAEQTERRIVVSGDARTEAAADRASFSAGVQAEARDARAAMEAASTAMQQVLAALRAAGVAEGDMQTREISVDPLWDDGAGGARQPAVRGYVAANLVAVRTSDVNRLGALIDAASAAGANRLMQVEFSLSDAAAQEAEARAAAVRDARAKAEQLAAAAGVALGPVISVSEQDGGGGPTPLFARAEAMSAAPPVAAGTVGVEVRVDVVFAIE